MVIFARKLPALLVFRSVSAGAITVPFHLIVTDDEGSKFVPVRVTRVPGVPEVGEAVKLGAVTV